MKKVVIVVAGGLALGGVGFLAAPAMAALLGAWGLLGTASTGTTISTLSGAALANASLAAIGGGSLAAGGTGMAGGTTVITLASTGVGARVTEAMYATHSGPTAS